MSAALIPTLDTPDYQTLSTSTPMDGSHGSADTSSTHWNLHLDVTRTWRERTLPVNSPQWRDIRSKVLKRDKFTCASCGYVSPTGKGMRVDHRDGSASNNNPSNLRVHCPPCEAIRHCGFAGLNGWIGIVKSNISQVEIVRKTREIFERCRVIPRITEVDSEAIRADIRTEEFANTLLEVNWEDLPEESKCLRGFFLENAAQLFSITMVTSVANRLPESTQVLDKSERLAMDIIAIERSLPWIRYSPESHGSLQSFLDMWHPSSTKQSEYAWICIDDPRSLSEDDHSPNVTALSQAWDEICAKNDVSLSEIDKIALEFGVMSGKWLVFAPGDKVDVLWSRIAKATFAGTLGSSAKVSLHDAAGPSRHVICIYTRDYTDRAGVDKARDGLRRLGQKGQIGYKPDIYTYCKIYSGNRWGIPPTRYRT